MLVKKVTRRCYGDVATGRPCRGTVCPVCKGRGFTLTEKGMQIREVLVYYGLVKEEE